MPLDPLQTLQSLSDPVAAGTMLGQAVGNAATNAMVPGANLPSGGSIFGLTLTQVVIIILGLLLIAAGIFSFDKGREVILQTAKTAATAAAA